MVVSRWRFEQALEEALDDAEDAPDSVGVIYVDLEGVILVNHRFGREQGDALLQEAQRHIVSAVPEAAAITRIGGDFALLLTGLHDPRDASRVADNVRQSLLAPLDSTDGVEPAAYVTCATGPGEGSTDDLLWQCAANKITRQSLRIQAALAALALGDDLDGVAHGVLRAVRNLGAEDVLLHVGPGTWGNGRATKPDVRLPLLMGGGMVGELMAWGPRVAGEGRRELLSIGPHVAAVLEAHLALAEDRERPERDNLTGLWTDKGVRAHLDGTPGPLTVALVRLRGEVDDVRRCTAAATLQSSARIDDVIGRLDDRTFVMVLPGEGAEPRVRGVAEPIEADVAATTVKSVAEFDEAIAAAASRLA